MTRHCDCVSLGFYDVVEHSPEPFVTFKLLTDTGWKYDLDTASFMWRGFCAKHQDEIN